jgi:hypothetical protein
LEGLDLLSLGWLHDVRATSLEPKDITETLALMMQYILLVLVYPNGVLGGGSGDIALRLEMMIFLQIENRRLGQKVIFPDVLLVISVLHFLLVNIIDEFLDLILAVRLG